MKNSFDGRLIGFLSSLVSDWEQTRAAPGRTVHLERNAVIRLQKCSATKYIEIKSGTIWLTATPARGDVLLEKGERFETSEDWPYVIQALEPAEILIVPASDS